jgi:hypothetical protein
MTKRCGLTSHLDDPSGFRTGRKVNAAGSGSMSENRLGRVVFNNKSCRLGEAASAARTRIRMA